MNWQLEGLRSTIASCRHLAWSASGFVATGDWEPEARDRETGESHTGGWETGDWKIKTRDQEL